MNKYILIVALAISSVTVKAATMEDVCEGFADFAHAATLIRHKEGMTLSKHLDWMGEQAVNNIKSQGTASAYELAVAIVEDIYAKPKARNPKLAARLYKYEVLGLCLSSIGE
jgi:hypothetical protein